MSARNRQRRRSKRASANRAPSSSATCGSSGRPGSGGARRATEESGPRGLVLFGSVVLLVVAAGIAWSNSFGGPFVFDDVASILRNPTIRDLSQLGQVLSPPTAMTVTSRPLVNLSLAINYAFGGTEVWGYHLLNLLLHIAAALTLLGILRRTLRLPRLAPRFGQAAAPLALTVALLWVVHPLHTAAVTYVIQRCELIMALFYLLTLYCVVRAVTAPRPGRWQIGAVLCCAAGMASKEAMVTAPLVVLLFDRLVVADSLRDLLRRRWQLHAGLFATLGVLLAVMAAAGFKRAAYDPTAPSVSWLDYALSQPGFIVHYLRLVIWPNPLVFDYGVDIARGAAAIVPYALIVAALLAATLVALRRDPPLAFLGAWFFFILAPTSSIKPITTQTAAEHRMFLPLAAVLALIVLGAHRAAQRWRPTPTPDGAARSTRSTRSTRSARRLAPAAAAVAVLATALAVTTYVRNRDYRGAMALWQDTIDKRPRNYRAHVNVGDLLLKENRNAEAIASMSRAIALEPDTWQAYGARGVAHMRMGRLPAAIADLTRAVEANPAAGQAYHARGRAYGMSGRLTEALADLDRVIELAPGAASAFHDRGTVHTRSGNCDAAIRDYDHAIALQPRRLDSRNSRALCLLQQGQTDRARADVRAIQSAGGRPDPRLLQLLGSSGG